MYYICCNIVSPEVCTSSILYCVEGKRGPWLMELWFYWRPHQGIESLTRWVIFQLKFKVESEALNKVMNFIPCQGKRFLSKMIREGAKKRIFNGQADPPSLTGSICENFDQFFSLRKPIKKHDCCIDVAASHFI